MLIQTFERTRPSERFTVAVNHLKSKGSSCDDDRRSRPRPQRRSGQLQPHTDGGREALANYLATDPTGSGDPDFLIIGDLNAYAMEDPITALTDAGYTDLIERCSGAERLQLRVRRPARLSRSRPGQRSAAAAGDRGDRVAHQRRRDPVFDYNDDIRDIPGEASFERETTVGPLYAPDPLRSSDHDPVLVGLGLDSIPDNPTCNGLAATIIGTPGDDVIFGTNKSDVIMSFGGNDTIFGGNGDDVICAGYGDDIVDGGNGQDLIFGEQGDDQLNGGTGKDSLEGGSGDDTLAGGNGKDTCVNLETVINCED